MEFNLRRLKSEDLFPMFTILSKIGFDDIRNSLSPENIQMMSESLGKGNTNLSTLLGFNITLTIVQAVLKNMSSCKSDLYSFLSSVSGMSIEELTDLDLSDFTELLLAVVQKEEFKDFFKVVAKLFK